MHIEDNELKLVSGHDGRRLASVSESVPTWTLDLKSGFIHPSLLVCHQDSTESSRDDITPISSYSVMVESA